VYDDRAKQQGVSGLNIPYFIPNEATSRAQKQVAPAVGVFDDSDDGYADDLAILSWSSEDLKIRVQVLNEVFKEFGLTINISKTETLIFNWDDDNTYPESILTIDGQSIKNSKTFRYLGVILQYNELAIGQEELSSRISAAHNAFAMARTMLTNKNIALKTRVMFLDSLVRTRLTYGCHAWRPSAGEIGNMDATYRYFLRHMIIKAIGGGLKPIFFYCSNCFFRTLKKCPAKKNLKKNPPWLIFGCIFHKISIKSLRI